MENSNYWWRRSKRERKIKGLPIFSFSSVSNPLDKKSGGGWCPLTFLVFSAHQIWICSWLFIYYLFIAFLYSNVTHHQSIVLQ
nr:hypothetical protein Itr_chr01CG09650 [Ipomoea trifida]